MYNVFNSTHHASAPGMRTEVGHFLIDQRIMGLKPTLSIEDQIHLLEKRGLIFEDADFAKQFLLKNNYYRLNIYFHKFLDSNNLFQTRLNFQHIVDIYLNDKWLRNKLLTILEPIEIKARTIIAYELGMKYGSDCFYRKEIYKNEIIHHEIQNAFSIEINRNRRDPIIQHHKHSYQGQFPIWVIVEFLSFNAISKLFGNLKEQDKKQIACHFVNVNENFLSQWLHVLSVQRNICAHYGYLYKREYAVRPRLYKEFKLDTNQNNELFAQFLIMKKLSENDGWQDFIQLIKEKEETNPSFNLIDYGFPENWKYYLFN